MSTPPLGVDVRGLERVAGGTKLLRGLNFGVAPGSLVAVMGASGSGKTTLLRCLAGDLRPHGGVVLVGGLPLAEHAERLRGFIAYVPQDDLVHGHVTVEESVRFAARLRLGQVPTEEIEARVERVLRALDLLGQRHLQVGDPRRPLLSGGQRKRVSLAQELVTDPALLLLDEPTSGLSTADAAGIVAHLRDLADAGRTVMATLHQPEPEVLEQFDQLILLQDGQLAWSGPPAEAVDFHGAGALRAALDPLAVMQFAREGPAPPSPAEPRPIVPALRPSPLVQVETILARTTLSRLRDRANLLVTGVQAPVVGGLTALLFAGEDPLRRNVPLFVLVVATLFFGCFNAAREVVGERTVLRRELAGGLSLGPYLLAKYGFLCTLGALQVAIMLALAVPAVGFEGALGPLYGQLVLTVAAATALGLLVSALVRSEEAALALVPVLLIPQLMLGGVLIGLEGKAVQGLAGTMAARWAVEATFENERRGLVAWDVPTGSIPCDTGTDEGCGAETLVCHQQRCVPCDQARHLAPTLSDGVYWRRRHLVCRGLTPDRPGVDAGALALMAALLLGLTGWRLRREARPD